LDLYLLKEIKIQAVNHYNQAKLKSWVHLLTLRSTRSNLPDMSSTIQVGKRTFTTEDICEQLSNSDLLPQVLREMIIDEILADWAIDLDGKIPYNREEFIEGCDRLGKLAGYQGLNQLQLYKIVDRHLRLRKFKYARWNNRVYSYYLQQKSRFDRVEFSLIGVTDRGLAEEIFFRVQSGEQSLNNLAFKYSECDAARDGGKIRTGDINRSYPEIAPHLASLQSGELSTIFVVDNLHTFVRLEGHISAELSDDLNRILIDELFETWVQKQISTRLGLFELEDTVDLPALVHNKETLARDPGLLKLINPIDRQPEIDSQRELIIEDSIEPSISFFYPKEILNQNYDFEDPADFRVCSSFFFPKELPVEIVRPPISVNKAQKVMSFLLFFVLFVGAEIIAMELFHRFSSDRLLHKQTLSYRQ
jgi:PPIC-type PPIASE domain